jgi:NAD-dependent SIR2 family protein deacetylase
MAEPMVVERVDALAELMAGGGVAMLNGAGLSTESGIPLPTVRPAPGPPAQR